MDSLVSTLNHLPFAYIWFGQLIFCYGSALVLMRYFGKAGLYAFMTLALIAANIQVNKLAMFPIFNQPIPLGNTLIAATYLGSDLLAEYYGAAAARKGVLLSMLGMIVMLGFIIFTLGFPPLTLAQANDAGVPYAFGVQQALMYVFPSVNILFLVSIGSYFIAQYLDVAVFVLVSKLTHHKWLWLRNILSTWLSALVDNFIFNLFAWRIFAAHPVPWKTLFISYFLGTFLLRIFIATLDTPFMYLGRKMMPKKLMAS